MALWMADVAGRTMNIAHHGVGILDTSTSQYHPSQSSPAPSPIHDHLRQLGVLQPKPQQSQAAIDEEVRRRFGF